MRGSLKNLPFDGSLTLPSDAKVKILKCWFHILLSELAISVCYCKSCWALWEVDGTVYWTAGSMTLL